MTTTDPTAKLRLILGTILVVLAWLLAAGTVIVLLAEAPEGFVVKWGWLILCIGAAAAAAGTYAGVHGVIQDRSLDD